MVIFKFSEQDCTDLKKDGQDLMMLLSCLSSFNPCNLVQIVRIKIHLKKINKLSEY